MLLHPKHEAFCQKYHARGNATEAARDAGYSYEYAATQGYRLLKTPEIQARLAELADEAAKDDEAFLAERIARRARLDAMVATEAATLLAKLDPVYEDRLESGDHDAVLKVIALQARICGLLQSDDGAARPRGVRKGRSGLSVDGHSLD